MQTLIDDQQLSQLSTTDRLEIIGRVWNSISQSAPELSITDAHAVEAQQRLADFKAGKVQAVLWEEVKRRLGLAQ